MDIRYFSTIFPGDKKARFCVVKTWVDSEYNVHQYFFGCYVSMDKALYIFRNADRNWYKRFCYDVMLKFER